MWARICSSKLASRHMATLALLRWDLVRNGRALPVPDVAQVLASGHASAASTTKRAIEITDAGWRKLGLLAKPAQIRRIARSQPSRFFLCRTELIGSLIPSSIGCADRPCRPGRDADQRVRAGLHPIP